MTDFTNCPVTKDTFGGANGSKIGITYNGRRYMLKFPSFPRLNKNIKYSSSSISEYIGCHIYQTIGIPAQNTILGIYNMEGGRTREVVACEILDNPELGINLRDFGSVKNTIIDSVNQGYGTDIYAVLETIDKQTFVDPSKLRDRFWDMFVIDEMIANPDRHNGNWGLIFNSREDSVSIAPVYDCGSSLFAQADMDTIDKILESQQELNIRVYERPGSALTINGRRINYYSFNRECLDEFPDYVRALERIDLRINLQEISGIIESTPGLSDRQIEFYKTIISARKELLIDKTLKNAEKLGMVQSDVQAHNLSKHNPRIH